jgi:hypothetical protein
VTTRAAELADLENGDSNESEGVDEAAAATPSTRRGVLSSGSSGSRDVARRPGFGSLFSSFGSAYRAPNVREDLRLFPPLLLSRGFLAAVALTVSGAVGEILFPGYSGSNFLFQFVTYPPALAPIFVAGFFAPRASYLLGLAVGVVDVLVLLVWAIALAPALGSAANPQSILGDLLPALGTNAVTGIVFGAGAAWYRRFLQTSNPRRQAQGKGQSNRSQGGRRTAAATSGRRRY